MPAPPSRPDRDANASVRRARSRSSAVLVAAIVLLALVASYAWREARRDALARSLVDHTVEAQLQVHALDHAVSRMESAHRAWLLGGDRELMREREAARQQSWTVLARLRGLTRDNPSQQSRIAAISERLRERRERMRKLDELAETQGLDAARAAFLPHGRGTVQPLGEAIAALGAAEAELFDQRHAAAVREGEQLRWLLALGPGLGILVLAAALQVLTRQLRHSEVLAAELGSSEARARRALSLVDASPDAMIIYDAASQLITWTNHGAQLQTGYSATELIGMPVTRIKSRYTRADLAAALEPLANGRQPALSLETWHRRKDGAEVPVEISLRYADLGAGPPSMVSIARDVTERRQAEAERDRFFELSLDLLSIAAPDGYFKRLNPAFARVLGWSVEELLARPYIEFIHPDDRQASEWELHRQVRDGEGAQSFENRWRHRDGSWRVLSWKSAVHSDGLVYATARDVTDHKRNEARIARLAADLRGRQLELEGANRELELLSHALARELRAPLGSLESQAQGLAAGAAEQAPESVSRAVAGIADTAARLQARLDELLALSQLGRKPLSSVPVDMAVLAREALAEVAGTPARAARVRIGALPPAQGDPELLRQAWGRLLGRALASSDALGDAASVEVGSEPEPGLSRYWVRGSGAAADPDADLALVGRIAARHGGEAFSEDAGERGARLGFTLPLAEPA